MQNLLNQKNNATNETDNNFNWLVYKKVFNITNCYVQQNQMENMKWQKETIQLSDKIW